MITAKNDTDHDDGLAFVTLERIERLILTCVGDKEWYSTRLERIKTEESANELIAELMGCQQIPGFHSTPQTLAEMKQAIQFSADKDDYSERRK